MVDASEHIPVPCKYGWFENECIGITDKKIADQPWPYLPIYRVTINDAGPVIYHSRAGVLYRVGHTFLSDRGSIPVFARWLITPSGYRLAYYYHDFACGAGGLYVSTDNGKTWKFTEMTRKQCDDLLYAMVGAMGANCFGRHAIWSGVRIGATWQRVPSGFWAVNADGSLSEFTDWTIPAMSSESCACAGLL